ncbi:Ubiquitin-conjugating enzyme E2 6 [Mortierella sp. GBA43]|nr:Ubiquitin-conjugating enzyme E2 6 [Mortierella sp. GBA43]
MATKGAYKRLTKEYINIQKSPPAYLFARPLESNILEWHYVLKGPPETPYHGGEYHGRYSAVLEHVRFSSRNLEPKLECGNDSKRTTELHEIFPELVVQQQVPLHIAFPNAPITESPPSATSPVATLSIGVTQRKPASAPKAVAGAQDPQEAGAAAATAATTNNVNANTAGAVVAAGAAGVAVKRASTSHWHKWLAFFLVFAYLVIAKTITRASASSSST